MSTVAVNIVPPQPLFPGDPSLSTTWKDDPISGVASNLPGGGWVVAAWIALLGSSISIIGANAGMIGSSRTLYALSKYKLVPGRFGAIHGRFRTPYVAIMVFGAGSILLVAMSSFGILGTSVDPLLLLGSLYNVGALVAYVQAHASLIITRNNDKPRFRPFKVPISIHFRRGLNQFELPLLPLLGLIATSAIWFAVIATHDLGRILGGLWVVMGMSLYAYFRRKSDLPVLTREQTLVD